MKTLSKVLIAALLAAATVAPALAADEGKYQVYMALWRGVTDAERGFMAYFKENGIPVEFIMRNAEEDKTRIPGFVEEVKQTRPDLVYTFGTTMTVMMAGRHGEQDPARHVSEVPVVFNIVADPLGAKLSGEMAGTGRNLTGASHTVPLETQVAAIATLGEFKTIGAIYNPLEANSRLAVDKLEALFQGKGVKVVRGAVPVENDRPVLERIPEVVARFAAEGVDLAYLPSDSFLISNAAEVVEKIHNAGIPTFSATESPIRKGGALIGIVSNYFTVGKFAGFKARQILEGRPAGEVPIETLAKYTFLVNLDTMRALRYYPPVTVLQFAEVIGQR